MAEKQFKFIPRYEDARIKQLEIVNYVKSLDTRKKNDKIQNFEDYFLVGDIYESCLEIIKNKDILKDRDFKAKVHTLVSSSKASDDLAYIAKNVDGVLESMRKSVVASGNKGEYEKLQENVQAWSETNKKIAELIESLKMIIDSSLKNGYGTYQQMTQLERAKFKENEKEIEKQLNENKTPEEVAKEFDVKPGYVIELYQKIIQDRLEANREVIIEKIVESTPRQEIADTINVSLNALRKYIKEQELNEIADEKRKAAPKAKAKAEPKAKAKAEPKAEPKVKAKAETIPKPKTTTTPKAKTTSETVSKTETK